MIVIRLKELLSELETLSFNDERKFRIIADRVKGIANNKFRSKIDYNQNVNRILESMHRSLLGFNEHHISKLESIIKTMIDDIELVEIKSQEVSNSSKRGTHTELQQINSRCENEYIPEVFIVHGHNETMKEATARTLEKLGLKVIILHEKANEGDTIIEKFTKHSNVGFVVVLLSADDFGYSKSDGERAIKLRARQNVIFELGFFYGKLGRKRVVAIFEQTKNFEKPSDIDGVVYIPYSIDGKWKFDLVKELVAIGYKVDSNLLIK